MDCGDIQGECDLGSLPSDYLQINNVRLQCGNYYHYFNNLDLNNHDEFLDDFLKFHEHIDDQHHFKYHVYELSADNERQDFDLFFVQQRRGWNP